MLNHAYHISNVTHTIEAVVGLELSFMTHLFALVSSLENKFSQIK